MQILIDGDLETEELELSFLAISVIFGMYGLKGHTIPEKEVKTSYQFEWYGREDGFRPEPEFGKFIRLRVVSLNGNLLNGNLLDDLAADLKGIEGFKGIILSPYEAEQKKERKGRVTIA